MTAVLLVVALIGLILFAVGAILYLFMKPANPTHVLLMVVGGLVFAIASIISTLIALF